MREVSPISLTMGRCVGFSVVLLCDVAAAAVAAAAAAAASTAGAVASACSVAFLFFLKLEKQVNPLETGLTFRAQTRVLEVESCFVP